MIGRNGIDVAPVAALRAALSAEPLLGFATSRWAEADPTAGVKPAFVGQLVGPPFQKQNLYTLSYDSQLNRYSIQSLVGSGGYTGRDAQDNIPNDNVNFVGDFQPDRFNVQMNGGLTFYRLSYIGKISDNSAIAGIDGNGNRYLLTDQTYPVGQPVTLVNDPANPFPVCFCEGTRIRTVRGDVTVETLAVGDLAVTASGAHRPIRWLGQRSIDLRRHRAPEMARPVRIAAGAFGEGRPARDLRVSPGHAVAVDVLGEVLIPALSLVDGTTVVQESVERVTYWHVELDAHDLLLAEGLPAESYLDMGNRGFFAGEGVVALHARPDADAADRRPPTHADFCRPFHAEGPLVDLVRTRLAARATDDAEGGTGETARATTAVA